MSIRGGVMDHDFYKQILMNAPFGYAYCGITGDSIRQPYDFTILETNNTLQNMYLSYQTKTESSIGDMFIALKGLMGSANEIIPALISNHSAETEQFCPICKLWLRITLQLFDSNHFYAIITDISNEKAGNINLENFFNINLDLMCIADSNGTFIKTNYAWQEILGYDVTQLQSSNFADFVHPDDIQPTKDAIIALYGKQSVHCFVNRYRSKSGKYKHFEWRARISDNCIFAAARDISQHIEYEEELKHREEKFRFLTESMRDVIWTLDTQTFTYTYVSPSVYVMRGFTPDEIIGSPIDLALLPEDLQSIKAQIAKRATDFQNGNDLDPNYSRIIELQQPCKDGSLIWTEVQIVYKTNPQTGNLEIHGVTRDITKRKLGRISVN